MPLRQNEIDFTRTLWILIFTAYQQLRDWLKLDLSTLIPASARTLRSLLGLNYWPQHIV